MRLGCRYPINCYNDKTRYKTMVILYTIDLIFFIIRLSLVSNDISKQKSDSIPFLVPILMFELIGSVPIIICNIIYIIMRHCVNPLNDNKRSSEYLWGFATLTCIRLHCHKNRPQAILLMRILIIAGSVILKFICFIISASCSAKVKSECTAYTVIGAFALIAFVFVVIVEFVNFFRLWKYNPTDTRNYGNNNQVGTADMDQFIEKTHRCHLGFIHHSLLNDVNSKKFRHSLCEEGSNCRSESLHHYLFYHSLESTHTIDVEKLSDNEKKSFIAFYQTTKQEALNIAQNGFPYGDNINNIYKDYLHLKQTIFFTRSCKQNSSSEAIICVRLNLGRIKSIIHDQGINLNDFFGHGDGTYDTIYVEKTGRFYLRMPGQIEKWIITINKNVQVNDALDGTPYQPCL